MRESEIENHLVETIKKRGGIAYKFSSPNRVSVPDRIIVLPGGVIYFVECKASGKQPTAAQEREHKRLRDLGFKVYSINSKEQVGGLP